MSLCEGEEIIKFLVRAVGLDMYLDADLLVPNRHSIVETEEPLQIDLAFQLCRQFLDMNPACGSMQDGRSGHAASQRGDFSGSPRPLNPQ